MSRSRRPLMHLARAIAMPALLASCTLFVGPGDADRDVRDLVAARARWNANGLTDYEVTATARCFCVLGGQPVRVTVRGGRVVSRVVIGTGAPVEASPGSMFGTVEQLFDTIEDAIHQRAHRVDATYDSVRGYPTLIFIDYLVNAADEEFGYQIDALVPLTR